MALLKVLQIPKYWSLHTSIFAKAIQNVQNRLNQNLVIGNFLEEGFEFSLRSETNVLRIWIWYFLTLCKLLSDEVEIGFWES